MIQHAHPPTAGDWRTEGVSDAVRIVVGEGRRKIILGRLAPPQIPETEAWANAYVMARAKDFLEALEEIERIHYQSNEGETCQARYQMAEVAYKAIEKYRAAALLGPAGQCIHPYSTAPGTPKDSEVRKGDA